MKLTGIILMILGVVNFGYSQQIISLNPSNGKKQTNIETKILSVTFDQNIRSNTGFISLKKYQGDSEVEQIDVSSVTIQDATATITLTNQLENGTQYYVYIDEGAFQYESSNLDIGIVDKDIWTFTTYSIPKLDDPDAIDEAEISPEQTLTVNGKFFSGYAELKPPNGGGISKILFYDNSGNEIASTTEDIQVVSDTKLMVEMPELLNSDGSKIPAGQIKIKVESEDEVYMVGSESFTNTGGTSDFSEPLDYYPLLSISDLAPANQALAVNVGTSFTITFDQNIQKNTGFISLKKADGSEVEQIDVNSVSVQNATATITLTNQQLENGTQYYIDIDEGAFQHESANTSSTNISFPKFEGSSDWSFTTFNIPKLDDTNAIDETEISPGQTLTINGKFFSGYAELKPSNGGGISKILFYDNSGNEIASTTENINIESDTKLNVKMPELLNSDGSKILDGQIKVKVESENEEYIIGTESFTNTGGESNFSEPLDYFPLLSISDLAPANQALAVNVGTSFTITFDQNIQPNTGFIYLKKADGSVAEQIDVSTPSVSVQNATATITLTNQLENGTQYYIDIDEGAFQHESANTSSTNISFPKFEGSSDWSFTTFNIPKLDDTNAIDETEISPGQTLTINGKFFSGYAELKPSNGGGISKILFYDNSGNEIASTTENINIESDTKLNVKMPELLNLDGSKILAGQIKIKVESENEEYMVGSESFTNTGGESNFSEPLDYFPLLSISDLAPANQALAVNVGTSFTITFDQNIQKNTGFIYLKKADGSEVEQIDVNSVSVQNATATITLTNQQLENGTQYYIDIDEGAFQHGSTNISFPKLEGRSDWSFTTYNNPKLDDPNAIDEAEISPGQTLTINGKFFSGYAELKPSNGGGISKILFYDNSGNEIASTTENINIESDTKLMVEMPELLNPDGSKILARQIIKIKVESEDEVYMVGSESFTNTGGTSDFSELLDYYPLLSILDLSPANQALAVVGTSFTITFDQNIQPNTGFIYLKKADGSVAEQIDVSTPSVSVQNPTATITLTNQLENGTQYYIDIDEGSFQHESANTSSTNISFPKFEGSSSWSFTTDHLPVLTGIDDISETVTNHESELTITGKFFSSVNKVIFYDFLKGEEIARVDQIDKITINNDGQLTVSVPQLENSTEIKIKLENAIGLSDSFSENIKYGGSEAIKVSSQFPKPSSYAVPISIEYLRINFNVNIQKFSEAGPPPKILIKKIDDNETSIEIDANSDKVITINTIAYISLDENSLSAGTKYYVEINEGVFNSGGVNYAGISGSETWNFSTFQKPEISGILENFTCNGKNLTIKGKFFQGVNSKGNINTIKLYDAQKTSILGTVQGEDSIKVLDDTQLTVKMPELEDYSGQIHLKLFTRKETIENHSNERDSSEFSDIEVYYGKPENINIVKNNNIASICGGSSSEYSVLDWMEKSGSNYYWSLESNTTPKFGEITFTPESTHSIKVDWIGEPFVLKKAYNQGDVVHNNGLIFTAKKDISDTESISIPYDNDNWKLITIVIWNKDTYYNKGDIANYNNIWYKYLSEIVKQAEAPDVNNKWASYDKDFDIGDLVQFEDKWYTAKKSSPEITLTTESTFSDNWKEVAIKLQVVETNAGGCIGNPTQVDVPKIELPPTIVISPSPASKATIVASFDLAATVTFGGVKKEHTREYIWRGDGVTTSKNDITDEKYKIDGVYSGELTVVTTNDLETTNGPKTVTCYYNESTCKGETTVTYYVGVSVPIFKNLSESYCQNAGPIELVLKDDISIEGSFYFSLFDNNDNELVQSSPPIKGKTESNENMVTIEAQQNGLRMKLETIETIGGSKGKLYLITEDKELVTATTDISVGVKYESESKSEEKYLQLIKIHSITKATIDPIALSKNRLCSNDLPIILSGNKEQSAIAKDNYVFWVSKIDDVIKSDSKLTDDEIESDSELISLNSERTAYEFNPGKHSFPDDIQNLDSAKVEVYYRYINSNTTCLDTTSLMINIYKTPNVATLDLKNLCIRDGRDSIPKASVIKTFGNDSGWTFTWSSDPLQTEIISSGSDPEFSPSNITSTTLGQEINYYVSSSGYKKEEFNGCKSVPQKLTYRIINLNNSPFTWNKRIVDGNKIEFNQENSINDQLIYKWDIMPSNENGENIEGEEGISIFYPKVGGVTADRYSVTLKAEFKGDKMCYSTLNQQVVVVNSKNSAPYSIDFNVNKEISTTDWISAGEDIIFEYGQPSPAKSEDLGQDYMWVTKLGEQYNILDKHSRSYLYSPSFLLKGISNPIVNFDYLFDTDTNIEGVEEKSPTGDGAVLQYSIDTGSEENRWQDRKWKNVGKINDGENWYNSSPLSAPAYYYESSEKFSTDNDNHGWSGTSTKPENEDQKSAIFVTGKNIVEIVANNDDDQIQFRFAFASSADPKVRTGVGFALKSFRVTNTKHKVLIENFTNLSTNGKNEQIQSNAIDRLLEDNKSSLIAINYHLNIPKPDPFSTQNMTETSGRAFYYNITNTPVAIMDGSGGSNSRAENNIGIINWGKQKLKQQLLTSSIVSLKIKPMQEGSDSLFFQDGKVSIIVEVSPQPNLDLTKSSLQVAIVESEFNKNSLTQSGKELIDSENITNKFNYILKKLLGARLINITPQDASEPIVYTYHFDWTPEMSTFYYQDTTKFQIIVFVQNDITKQVYETEISKQFTVSKDLISGIEPSISNLVVTYPNPSDEKINVKIFDHVSQQSTIRITNQFGREVLFQQFDSHTKNMEILTKNLVSGLYILQIKLGDKAIIRKKIIVEHN